MEIILNELSIDGQFGTLASFEDYFAEVLKDIFEIMQERHIALYKKSEIFGKYITNSKTVQDYLTMRNQTVATQMKKLFIQLAYMEPYWDQCPRTNPNCEYRYVGEYEEPNCITEAIERSCPLLSFPSKAFTEEKLQCKRAGREMVIENIKSSNKLLEEYLKMYPKNITYVLGRYPFGKKVVLAEVDEKCYTTEALIENDLSIDDYLKMIHNIPRLIEDKANGRKTHLWDTLDGEICEYRISVSSNREFRLFFLWRKSIIFLNGYIKKSGTTPQSEKKKAKGIVDKIADRKRE